MSVLLIGWLALASMHAAHGAHRLLRRPQAFIGANLLPLWLAVYASLQAVVLGFNPALALPLRLLEAATLILLLVWPRGAKPDGVLRAAALGGVLLAALGALAAAHLPGIAPSASLVPLAALSVLMLLAADRLVRMAGPAERTARQHHAQQLIGFGLLQGIVAALAAYNAATLPPLLLISALWFSLLYYHPRYHQDTAQRLRRLARVALTLALAFAVALHAPPMLPLMTVNLGLALVFLLIAWWRGPRQNGAMDVLWRPLAWLGLQDSRHDYRREWWRLIQTVADPAFRTGLSDRLLSAVCQITGAKGGLLLLHTGDTRFRQLAGLNTVLDQQLDVTWPGLVGVLAEHETAVDLLYPGSEGLAQLARERPSWLPQSQHVRLLLPLHVGDRPIGLIVLHDLPQRGPLPWQTVEMLQLVARQVALLLAENLASQRLAENQQFERFNQRYSFLLHDLKNIASQMRLMVSNAEAQRGNIAFYDQLVDTLSLTSARLDHRLADLRGSGQSNPTRAPIADVLNAVVRSLGDDRLSVGQSPIDLHVPLPPEHLHGLLTNLTRNALEAITPQGAVHLQAHAEGSDVMIEVIDNGAGMARDFVRDALFRPFVSNKSGGLGIGVYEARAVAEEVGGRLDVETKLGRGTIMRLVLPQAIANRTGNDVAA